ncbi:MAG: hypothetical protein HYZ46_09580 [Nitrosomonadales bacterium]|nr:hypothetical protein [Nitrosomonadales bacterium]
MQKHLKFTISKPDGAHHCSIPFLAYRRGCLVGFTKSLHRFALDGNKLQKEVTAQYKSDLRETWIFEIDEISRFKKARNYRSRLAELDFARWLESQQWHVSNLEMYGGQFDVEGQQKGGIATTFEVKFLAQREVLFELNLASFTNPTAGSLGVYSPIDYLLFRLHEAACKLQETDAKRIAVAIVSDYDISYRIPLSEGWIDWVNPRFLRRDSEIQQFLSDEYAKNPNLDADLMASISSLDEIWILRYQNTFELHLEHRIIVP